MVLTLLLQTKLQTSRWSMHFETLCPSGNVQHCNSNEMLTSWIRHLLYIRLETAVNVVSAIVIFWIEADTMLGFF